MLTDGASHAVDSSELAFKIAARGAVQQACDKAGAVILEPVMQVQVVAPDEYQGGLVGGINKRKGMIEGTETMNGLVTINCLVPLANMFGYSTELRSGTQGKGEYTMEYKTHMPVMPQIQEELIKDFRAKKAKEAEAKK